MIATLSRELPDDAIVTNGAGNYAGFLNRYFQYKGFPTQLAPASGSMGYGLPAAIAAKLIHPGRAGGRARGRWMRLNDGRKSWQLRCNTAQTSS